MSDNSIELDEVALNNLRSDYKQHLLARNAKGPIRPQAKNGQKNMQQKNQYPTAKGRTPIRSQKNNADSPVRHNSQK